MEKIKGFMDLEDKVVYPQGKTEGIDAIAGMINKLKNEKKAVFGTNATNRALIQGKVRMVVVSAEENPLQLNDHILQICSKKKIPVISLAASAVELGKKVGKHSLGAAGILNTVEEEVYNVLLPYSELIPPENFLLYQ